MIAHGVFLCCKRALVILSVLRDPVCERLFLSKRFADLTATSALLLLRGLYAVVILCITPYFSKNSSTILDVNTLAPSDVNESGIPKIEKYSRKARTSSSLVSLCSCRIESQLLYLSTITENDFECKEKKSAQMD